MVTDPRQSKLREFSLAWTVFFCFMRLGGQNVLVVVRKAEVMVNFIFGFAQSIKECYNKKASNGAVLAAFLSFALGGAI